MLHGHDVACALCPVTYPRRIATYPLRQDTVGLVVLSRFCDAVSLGRTPHHFIIIVVVIASIVIIIFVVVIITIT